MYSFWLRILIFLGVLWLIRRLFAHWLTAAKGSGQASPTGGSAGRAPNHTVKDPVCGMYMDPRLALKIGDGEKAVFFCSDACKEKFLAQSR